MQSQVTQRIRSALLALLLLLLGSTFLLATLYVILLSGGNLRDPAKAQLALGMYFKVVIVKGVLAQLLLAIPIHWMLAQRLAERRGGPLLAWGVATTLAYMVVSPLLLSRAFENWPALEMVTLGQHLATLTLMVGATTACGRIAERWTPGRSLSPERPVETVS
jgi:hypothetical protein